MVCSAEVKRRHYMHLNICSNYVWKFVYYLGLFWNE